MINEIFRPTEDLLGVNSIQYRNLYDVMHTMRKTFTVLYRKSIRNEYSRKVQEHTIRIT